MIDDAGYGDLSSYGRPDYQTPNLDALAAQRARFTQAYAAAPVCTPTHTAFVTGRYPQRTAVGLEPETFAKLKAAYDAWNAELLPPLTTAGA